MRWAFCCVELPAVLSMSCYSLLCPSLVLHAKSSAIVHIRMMLRNIQLFSVECFDIGYLFW